MKQLGLIESYPDGVNIHMSIAEYHAIESIISKIKQECEDTERLMKRGIYNHDPVYTAGGVTVDFDWKNCEAVNKIEMEELEWVDTTEKDQKFFEDFMNMGTINCAKL